MPQSLIEEIGRTRHKYLEHNEGRPENSDTKIARLMLGHKAFDKFMTEAYERRDRFQRICQISKELQFKTENQNTLIKLLSDALKEISKLDGCRCGPFLTCAPCLSDPVVESKEFTEWEKSQDE